MCLAYKCGSMYCTWHKVIDIYPAFRQHSAAVLNFVQLLWSYALEVENGSHFGIEQLQPSQSKRVFEVIKVFILLKNA